MTNVQQEAIPFVLQGKDALIKSQTGSGKIKKIKIVYESYVFIFEIKRQYLKDTDLLLLEIFGDTVKVLTSGHPEQIK